MVDAPAPDDAPAPRPPRPPPPMHPVRALANELATALGETNFYVKKLLFRLTTYCDETAVRDALARTLEIEQQGGMLLEREERRRTPGGVFFHLMRQVVAKETARLIWYPKNPNRPPPPPPTPKKVRPTKAPKARVPPPPWEDAFALAQIALAAELGHARNVKVMLMGRPGPIQRKDSFVVTTMQEAKLPSLPKGLPEPPATPETYTVYVTLKHWKRVEAALAADSTDQLVIEGFAKYVPALKGVAIFATNTNTLTLQRAEREARIAAAPPA